MGLDGEQRLLEIEPDSVIDPTVRHAQIVDEDAGIGYLAVTSFSRETAEEFDGAIEFLRGRGLEGLIIDLRQNRGGLWDAAVAIANRFIPEGTIASTEGRGDPIVYRAQSEEATLRDLPLVLLVDEDSASSSEVLAGALQDHRVAVVVGRRTYGKGVVQTIRSFDEFGTRAKITTSFYYSPSGRNFDRSVAPEGEHGIQPDLDVEVPQEAGRQLLTFLRSYGPGPEEVTALEAWEAAEGLDLIEDLPVDAQLTQALTLFEPVR